MFIRVLKTNFVVSHLFMVIIRLTASGSFFKMQYCDVVACTPKYVFLLSNSTMVFLHYDAYGSV